MTRAKSERLHILFCRKPRAADPPGGARRGRHQLRRANVCGFLFLIVGAAWIVATGLGAARTQGVDRARGKIRRLLQEVWKEPPSSMDIEFFQKLVYPPRSKEDVQRQIKSLFESMRDNTWVIGPNGRAVKDRGDDESWRESFELTLQAALALEGKPRYFRKRIRYTDGGRFYREDLARQTEATFGKETPWTETYVNVGPDADGYYESYVYYHKLQKADRMAGESQPFWDVDHVWRIGTVGEPTRAMLRGFTCKTLSLLATLIRRDKRRLQPDEDKLSALINGTHPLLTITIEEDSLKGRPTDRYEVKLRGLPYPSAVIYTASDDVTRVYRSEAHDPRSGRTLMVCESESFDESGFPRTWREVTYRESGEQVVDERQIVRVVRDPEIPREVFEFRPPKGFLVGEQIGNEIVIRLPDGKVQRASLGESEVTIRRASVMRRYLFWLNLCLTLVVLGYMFWARRRRRSASQQREP